MPSDAKELPSLAESIAPNWVEFGQAEHYIRPDSLDIGFPPDRKCDVAVDLLCYVEIGGERINCQDIPMPEDEEDCDKEVIYSYIVTNVGTTGKTVELIERERDGETEDITMLADRLQLAPGEFAIARELRQTIDFCIARIVTTGKEVGCYH